MRPARLTLALACTALLALVQAVSGAGAAGASSAPDRSLRPLARPDPVAAVPVAAPRVRVPVYYTARIRPRPRGGADVAATPAPVPETFPVQTAAAAPAPASATRSTSAAPRVYFTATARPRARPWLGRTQPAGSPSGAVLVPVAATPAPVAPTPAPQASVVRVLASSAPVYVSPRPPERPDNLQRRGVVRASGLAQVTPRQPGAVTGPQGSICGDPDIVGRRLPPIAGRLQGCGLPEPVQVTMVAGVRLSTPATLNCATARALKTWVTSGALPAVGRLGGGVSELRVAAHYACRTRNNQPGEKISEHGRGKAIDISAIRLRNGVSITLLEGWRDATHGPILKRMQGAACGPFGTVLGPNANRFHQDHFHFDTASYRSGPYCR